MNFPPRQPSSVAPGMKQVVVAGELYSIEDDKGEVLELEGREHPLVLDFINAFDNWHTIDKTMHVSAVDMREMAWKNVMSKWNAMPGHIIQQLPSIRASGLIVP